MLFLIKISDQEKRDRDVEIDQENLQVSRTPTSAFKKNLDTSSPATTEKEVPPLIQKHVPTQTPIEDPARWSHHINFQDDLYLDTQLQLDGYPVEGYINKWRKDESGEVIEHVAGTLPKIDRVNGAFPSPAETKDIVNAAVGAEAEVIATEELWSLNSERVLSPQVKVQVLTRSRSQRSSGSEYWFVSLNSGKILKRIEADRF